MLVYFFYCYLLLVVGHVFVTGVLMQTVQPCGFLLEYVLWRDNHVFRSHVIVTIVYVCNVNVNVCM